MVTNFNLQRCVSGAIKLFAIIKRQFIPSNYVFFIYLSLFKITFSRFKVKRTVKPVLRGHPREGQKVAAYDR